MIRRFLDHFGVTYRWRAGMCLHLAELRHQPSLPEGYVVLPWDESRLLEVAAVDYRAYQGTVDGQLYQGYFSSVEGCARMWREGFGGRFGRFDPDRTLLLARDGTVCGDILVAQTGPQEAFVGNLAVDPAHQGGTGKALLLTCLWNYRRAGFARVSLAVTYENHRAFALYEKVGFRVTSRFPKLTLLPGLRRPRPARSA